MQKEAMDTRERYTEASVKTASSLKAVARSETIREISSLSLPEIDAVADLVARMIPAGNVPGVILNGLARLAGRRPPFKTVKRDVNLLFKGVEQALDRIVYTAFFAGPAAVIWGYQNLLKLAGKDPEDSFPEGTWQFYAYYALREDTARHANETHGFDTTLAQHQIHLSAVDRITAWVMAAIHCLYQYNALLENEWRERVYTHLLRQVTADGPDAPHYASLYRQWEKQRPYGRGPDTSAGDDYPTYRRVKFDAFLEEAMGDLDENRRHEWASRLRVAEQRELPAYQQQMSILTYLEPGTYGETRRPIPLRQACVGVIYQGRYHLIAACSPGTNQPEDVDSVRGQVAALVTRANEESLDSLTALARAKRAAASKLRTQMSQNVAEDLDALQLAPILVNCDPHPRDLPLSELRRVERGVGDHALTILDTGETFVFDQSHIFFDGTWGAALAEILTNEALSWAVYLHSLPPAQPGEQVLRTLPCDLQPSEQKLILEAPRVTPEVGVESTAVDLQAIQALRKLFKVRSDLLEVTVNDLLVLYRAIHAATYQPDPALVEELRDLRRDDTIQQAALASLEAIENSRQMNPPILILVDASQRSPRDRVYPMTFTVPLAELDLLNLHAQVVEALSAFREAAEDRTALYAKFDRLQRVYLATLAGFGQVMSRAKEIAIVGESASVGTIKLLAHLPSPLQHMLDKVPGRFDLLNDIIKGREIFSNIGVVAPSSTLTRFITAKDDNDKKTLAWGIMTDSDGAMCITLRDFRPHVGLLQACGRKDLAARIAQDYLDAYAQGLNGYVRDLHRITRASRETHSR
jgi:hypothetical protein